MKSDTCEQYNPYLIFRSADDSRISNSPERPNLDEGIDIELRINEIDEDFFSDTPRHHPSW